MLEPACTWYKATPFSGLVRKFPHPRAGPSFACTREGHGEVEYGVHSPVDSIVAAEYALYVAEQLQVAVYAPLGSRTGRLDSSGT